MNSALSFKDTNTSRILKSFVFLSFSFLLVACTGTAQNVVKPHKAPTTLYDYQLQDANGQAITQSRLLNELAPYDVVMVGEWHAHPAVHLFQARLMADLVKAERPLTLTMEQFTRADQNELNRYLAGEIGESRLMKNTKVWKNYKSDYRPLVEIARQQSLPVVAANAPRNHVKCIGKEGPGYLNRLSPEQRALVAANVDISDSPYRQKFLGEMKGMRISEERIGKMFGAQMAWDATMAESIALHLKEHPGRRVLHVAGRFHTIGGLGTGAELLKLNPDLKIAYITAITPGEEINNNDYRLVVPKLPELWVSDEERKAYMPKHKASKTECGAE